jgi:serine/threonine protein phosphatase PrpC
MLIMAAIAALGVYAQAADVAEKILGTWTDQEGNTWTFDSSGYLTVRFEPGDPVERTRYGVAGSRLFFMDTVWDVSISADGRTLIIAEAGDSRGYWLTSRY